MQNWSLEGDRIECFILLFIYLIIKVVVENGPFAGL